MTKSKLYVKLECAVWHNDKGKFHREDAHAYEHSNGFKAWYLNGISCTEKDYNAKIKTLR